MATTVEAVNYHLETDPAVADALRRGLINLRRTARWMIDEYGWPATEEAVVSALRRYRDERLGPVVWSTRPLLYNAGVELRDGLALVTVPRVPEVYRNVFNAWLDSGGTGPLGVLPGKTRTRLLVEEREVDGISAALGPGVIRETLAPVALIRLVLHCDQERGSLVGLVLNALAHHGVEIVEIVSCDPEWLVLVHDKQILEAHRVISALTNRDRVPAPTQTD